MVQRPARLIADAGQHPVRLAAARAELHPLAQQLHLRLGEELATRSPSPRRADA